MEELNNQLKEQKYTTDEPERVVSLTGYQNGQSPVRHDEQAAMDESARILSSDKRARSVGIWKDLPNAQRGANAPQETFEAMQGLRKGGRVAVWDIETLGTASHNRISNPTAIDFFSITELAIKTGKYTGDVGKPFDFARSIEESILVAPDKQTTQRLQGAIDSLKTNGFKGTVLNQDLQRSLAALTQYSDPKNFKKGNEVTRISGHASTRVGTGSVLAKRSSIQAMQQGLLNLQTYGTSFENALTFLDKIVGEQTTFAGHNVHGFDRPAMLDSIEQKLAKNNTSGHIASAITRLQNNFKASQIDTLELAKAVTVSPYTKFGANMKLGGIYASSGKEVTNAHLGIYDVKMNADILNQISGMSETRKVMSSLKENVVKTGDVFFSKQGLQKFTPNPFQAGNGKHDGIFRFEDGKYVPVAMGDAGALFKNQSYKVKKQYSDLSLGGRNQYGVLLENEDTGLFHFLAREKKSDLAAIFQNTMEHVPREEWRQMRLLRERDNARRGYEKMFSFTEGNGVRGIKTAYRALDLYDEEYKKLKAQGVGNRALHGKAVEASLKRMNENQKPEYQFQAKRIEQSLLMRGRLDEERPFWEKAVGQIEKVSGAYKTRDARVDFENAALVGLRKDLDAKFGDIPDRYGTDGSRRFELKTATGVRQLDANRPETFRNAIGGLVNNNAPRRVKEQQIIEFAEQMQKQGLYTREKAEEFLSNARKDIESTGRLSVNLKVQEAEALRASVLVKEKYETSVEGTRLSALPASHDRRKFINGLQSSQGLGFANDIISKATEEAKKYVRNDKVIMHSIMPKGATAERLAQHEASLRKLYEASGLQQFGKKQPVGDMLTEMVQSYGNQGFGVDLRYSKERDKMTFFFGESKDVKQMVNMTFDELMQSNKVSSFEIPLQKADGTIRLGGQDYNNRFFAGMKKSGGVQVESFFEQYMRRMKNQAKKIRDDRAERIQLGETIPNMLDAQQKINRTRNNIAGGLISRHYSGYTGDDIERGEAKLSQMARLKTGTHIDMKGLAETWHQDQEYMGVLKGTAEIQSRIEKDGGSFFDHMNREARQLFDSTITDWAKMRGLDTHYHGVNDKQAAAGIRATDDVRGFYVAGMMSPTARENLDKAANYRPLDRDYTVEKMQRAGMSQQEIDRRLRFSTTDKFANARQLANGMEETSHINMRMAMVNDFQLTSARSTGIENLDKESRELKANQHLYSNEEYSKKLIEIEDAKKFLQKDGLLTVHDGMGIMREDIMSAFDFKRESTIKMNELATIKPELKQMLLNRLDGKFDPNVSVGPGQMSSAITFEDLHRAGLVDKNGTVTVADIVKDDMTKEDGKFKRWHNDWAITGYDAEKKRFVVTENDKMTSSGKMIALDGDRNTYRGAPKKAIQAMFGKDIDGVMYQLEINKQMGSTFLNSKVQLYEQELISQMNGESKAGPMLERYMKDNNITVADLAKQDVQTKALEDIYKPKLKQIGFNEDAVSAQNGRMIFDHKKMPDLDANGEGTHAKLMGFMQDMDKSLGADFTKRGYEVGQKQLARHDVYTTEDIGEKVRIGQKEVQILESKYGKDSQYAKFIRKTLDNKMGAGDARAVQNEFGKFLTNARSGPKSGDLVFDFSGGVDSDDLYNARPSSTGAISIDGRQLKDLPDPVTAGTLNKKFHAEDYAGTIMDTSKVKFRAGKQEKMVAEYLSETNGQAFLKLPQMYEGQQEYVPWMDLSRLHRDEIGESPMFRDIEKKQMALYRNIKDYEALGKHVNVNDPGSPEYQKTQLLVEERAGKLQRKIQQSVKEVEESVVQYGTSSRKSGMQASLDSTILKNSGQFRAQTVNPFDMYQAKVDGEGKRSWENRGTGYQEGTMYLSRNQMKEMIAGEAQQNIMDIVLTEKDRNDVDATFADRRATYTKEYTTKHGAEIDPKGFKEYQKRMKDARAFNDNVAHKEYLGDEPFFPSEKAILKHMGVEDAYLERTLDKLTKGNEQSEIFGILNRNPSTSDRTMQAVRMLIDPSLEGQERGAIITPGTLLRMNGDTDGDTVYAQMSHYSAKNAEELHEETRNLYHGERKASMVYGEHVVEKEARMLDENMLGYLMAEEKRRLGDANMSTKSLESQIGDDGIRGLRQRAVSTVNDALTHGKGAITVGSLTAAGFSDGQAQSFFRFKNTGLDDMLSQEARLGKTLLGSIDNIRQNMRDLHEIYSSRAHDSGLYGAGDEAKALWDKRREKVQLFGEVISQDLISSKKLDPITMMNQFRAQGVAESDLMQATADELRKRRSTVSEVERLLKSTVTESDAEELKQHLQSLNLFTGEKEAMYNEASMELRNMNYATAPYGGLENPSLKMKSDGMRNADELHELLQSGNFHPTRQVQNVVDSLQGELRESAERTMERYNKTVSERIGSLSEVDAAHEAINFRNYREQRSAADIVMKTGGETIAQRAGRHISNGIGSALENTTEALMRNGAMAGAVGVSFAAMWGMSSLMRSGPTPEGMREEQQLASAAEVNPSSLLTSPTARVTPNSEAVNLRIEAKGSMDHNELAGMVNGQIQAQTGVPLNMQMNVQDNRSNIDEQYIQQIVAQAVGHGFIAK